MRNISIKKYTQLADVSQYDILEHLNPVNSFAGQQMNINAMPYANVKYCIRLLQKVDNWDVVQQLFEICFDVNAKKFWKQGVKEYFQAKKYLIREFDRVLKTEAHVLKGQSTDEHLWQIAGADRLKPYSDTLPLVQLGKMFGKYPFDLGRKPYSEVFSLLAQVKTQNEVESEYQKLKNQ